MIPEAGCTLGGMVSKRLKIIDQFAVFYPAGCGESVHTMGGIGKDASIYGKVA